MTTRPSYPARLGPPGHIRNTQAHVPINFDHLRSQGWRLDYSEEQGGVYISPITSKTTPTRIKATSINPNATTLMTQVARTFPRAGTITLAKQSKYNPAYKNNIIHIERRITPS
jgi:hypothetical protein